MRHPNQAALALHAGGDLSVFARWRMERHLAGCDRCRGEVAAFQALRSSTADLNEIPELPWQSMAAEMRANIRLGISAGECVRPAERKPAPRFGWRPVAAIVGVAALLVAAVAIEFERYELTMLPVGVPARVDNAFLQTAPDGIGSQSLRLMYRGARDVQLTASAGGSIEAHYTDPKTSYMTVSEVDAQ